MIKYGGLQCRVYGRKKGAAWYVAALAAQSEELWIIGHYNIDPSAKQKALRSAGARSPASNPISFISILARNNL